MPNEVDKILEERQHTHGDFRAHAGLCQSLKQACRAHPGFSRLTQVQAEGIDMILHKIARAINGQASYVDHWADCAGYAELVRRDLENK